MLPQKMLSGVVRSRIGIRSQTLDDKGIPIMSSAFVIWLAHADIAAKQLANIKIQDFMAIAYFLFGFLSILDQFQFHPNTRIPAWFQSNQLHRLKWPKRLSLLLWLWRWFALTDKVTRPLGSLDVLKICVVGRGVERTENAHCCKSLAWANVKTMDAPITCRLNVTIFVDDATRPEHQ